MKVADIYHILVMGLLFVAVLIATFLYVKVSSNQKLSDRVKPFILESKDDNEKSLIDIFVKWFINRVKGLSKLLSKSQIAKNYGNYFEKYLIYDDSTVFEGIDYISIKIFGMILVQILYLVSLFIKFLHFNIYVFILASIIGFFFVDIVVIFFYKRKKNLIEEQLLQAIVIMNNAFKSGKNILQAITIVKNELPSPIKEEFEIIYQDINYGLDLTVVFDRFAKRVKVPEARYITSSLSLLNKTGGNIVTVFNMIERTFYERLKIKDELAALTAASKFLYKALLVMPFIFALVIVTLNPEYFNSLISTKAGLFVDLIILILYALYIVIIKRVMKVDEV